MNIRIPLLITLAGFSCAAVAIPDGPSSKAQAVTEAWLQLQPKGIHDSSIPQAATATEREKAMERWIKVYNYEIPEHFKWEKMNSDGGGGSK